MITHIQHETEHCERCLHYMVVTGGSAVGGDVTAYQLCANCGEHRERLATFEQDVTPDELAGLVDRAF